MPTAAGVEALAALARQGVKISVLTNSLAATDVAAVHAGYARRRQAAARGRRVPVRDEARRVAPRRRRPGLTGSSASSLHAKTFAVDRARIFIGSFNFDPRSARLNTEMGFVIDSPALAHRLADVFASRMPASAYEVRLGADGALQWVEGEATALRCTTGEPGAGLGLRIAVCCCRCCRSSGCCETVRRSGGRSLDAHASIGARVSLPTPRDVETKLATVRLAIERDAAVRARQPHLVKESAMPQLTAYLSFDGTCTQAMKYYERVLGGKLEALITYAQAPAMGDQPCPPSHSDRIMHAYLVHKDFALMAGDTPPGVPHNSNAGNHAGVELPHG